MPSFFPTQIGFTPTGSVYGSQVVVGRNMSSSWEAAGLGAGGRPDPVDRIYFNLSLISGLSTPLQTATIAFDTQSLIRIVLANPNAPSTGFYFAFRELQVCDNGTTRAMTFLASQPYAPSS